MINVKVKICEHAGCSKAGPSFNFEGEQGGRFCAQHKLQGMEDVKNKSCEHAGCSKVPTFNYDGEQQRRFCAHHKLPGMVNVREKKCEHGGCGWEGGFLQF